ncbi:hypothetical protein [Staphylococcus xylosus]|uniref:hypothetical protein n=1 Tax=Staphylococcus xylosus TaxID=1288 RepID=UPI00164DBBF7|nr:hypothetical protein [Staphylococcus xylosus]
MSRAYDAMQIYQCIKNDYNTLILYVYEKNVRLTDFYLKHNFVIKSKNIEEAIGI